MRRPREAAADGIVADSEPHFHRVSQDLNRAYAAHLGDASFICYLAEVVIADLKDVELTPVRNEHGISLLQEKE